MNRNQPNRVSFGPFLLDSHTHELWKHGVRIKLSGQPLEVLSLLVQNPGHLITREQLRALLWPGETFVDFEHSLNVAINKLREALNDSADVHTYIETLPRRGYRFIANPIDSSEMGAPSVSSKGGGLNSTDSQPSVVAVSKLAFFAASFRPYLFAATVLVALLIARTFVLLILAINQ
jgi:DNA-binding winged helix-turn-helix (wHTH) protein